MPRPGVAAASLCAKGRRRLQAAQGQLRAAPLGPWKIRRTRCCPPTQRSTSSGELRAGVDRVAEERGALQEEEHDENEKTKAPSTYRIGVNKTSLAD